MTTIPLLNPLPPAASVASTILVIGTPLLAAILSALCLLVGLLGAVVAYRAIGRRPRRAGAAASPAHATGLAVPKIASGAGR